VTDRESEVLRQHGEIIAAMSANLRNVEKAISHLGKSIDGYNARCDARHISVDGSIADAHSRISSAKDSFSAELGAIKEDTGKIKTAIESMRGDYRVLQVKAGIWGMIAGSIPSTIVAIAIYFKG
jgi:hypothetical protein